MPVNSSSNILPSPPLVCSINSSFYSNTFSCFIEHTNSVTFTIFTLMSLFLVLPLCVLVAWMGFRQKPTGATSHTDVFTYYMVVIEMINGLGLFLSCCGIYACSPAVMVVAYLCVLLSYSGQTLFHGLTCVERYLAVVHPVTYMGLRRSQGVRIRNISISGVWLLCFGVVGFAAHIFPRFPTDLLFYAFAIILMIVCFCSLSVFRVLIRPGVGSDQSKRRAFHTVLAITGLLVLRFCGHLVFLLVLRSVTESDSTFCSKLLSGGWLSLPSSLVLPLLYLHRRGTLACQAHCWNQTEVSG